MPRYITILTPENVKIDYELAGVASRAGAAVIDAVLQGTVMIGLGIVYAFASSWLHIKATNWPTAVVIIVEFLIYWGYYIYFETAWNGQTPGKRSLRLRVIRDGGLPIDLGCAAIRNLIRPLDTSILGLIVILAGRRNQRLGDLAAGTLVVKERAEWTGDIERVPTSFSQAAPAPTMVKNIELVRAEEFNACKRFLERKAELREEVREDIAARIARPLMRRLGIQDEPGIVYSDLLAEVYRLCVERRGMR